MVRERFHAAPRRPAGRALLAKPQGAHPGRAMCTTCFPTRTHKRFLVQHGRSHRAELNAACWPTFAHPPDLPIPRPPQRLTPLHPPPFRRLPRAPGPHRYRQRRPHPYGLAFRVTFASLAGPRPGWRRHQAAAVARAGINARGRQRSDLFGNCLMAGQGQAPGAPSRLQGRPAAKARGL